MQASVALPRLTESGLLVSGRYQIGAAGKVISSARCRIRVLYRPMFSFATLDSGPGLGHWVRTAKVTRRASRNYLDLQCHRSMALPAKMRASAHIVTRFFWRELDLGFLAFLNVLR